MLWTTSGTSTLRTGLGTLLGEYILKTENSREALGCHATLRVTTFLDKLYGAYLPVFLVTYTLAQFVTRTLIRVDV